MKSILCLTIINLFILLNLLSYIIMAFKCYKLLNDYKAYYIYSYGMNWDLGPILDIQIAKNECPLEYQIIARHKFEGYNPGCYCGFNGSLYLGNCNLEAYSRGCEDINRIKETKLPLWHEFNLCGKRMKRNYLSLNISNDTLQCEENYKKCGILDQYENILCVNKTEECPINFFQILNRKNYDEFTKEKDIYEQNNNIYKIINFGENYIMTSNTMINNSIPIQFQIGEIKSINLKPTHTHTHMLDKYYYEGNNLELTNFNVEQIILDENLNLYKQVDAMNYYDFLKDNNLLRNLSKIPYLSPKEYYNYPIYLMTRGYIGLKNSYYNYLKEKIKFLDLNNFITTFKNKIAFHYQKFSFSIVVFNCILLPVIFSIHVIPNFCFIKYFKANKKFKVILDIISSLLVFINLMLITHVYLMVKKIKAPYNIIFLEYRNEDTSNQLLYHEFDKITWIRITYLGIIVISLINIPLFLVEHYYARLFKIKKY